MKASVFLTLIVWTMSVSAARLSTSTGQLRSFVVVVVIVVFVAVGVLKRIFMFQPLSLFIDYENQKVILIMVMSVLKRKI